MAETPQDVVNRELREFRRYTGDGLPGEPVNAPLPVGDPQSGVHNPKKVNLRKAMLAPIEAAAQSASDAKDEADRAEEEADRSDAAADRAENSASSFIEVATNFKTVTALLADETMGYSGSGKDVIVGEGDIVTAQGFRYEVAASDAVDAHVETAGGVKLCALPNGDGSFDLAQFGAGSDISGSLSKAVEVAAGRKIIIPSGSWTALNVDITGAWIEFATGAIVSATLGEDNLFTTLGGTRLDRPVIEVLNTLLPADAGTGNGVSMGEYVTDGSIYAGLVINDGTFINNTNAGWGRAVSCLGRCENVYLRGKTRMIGRWGGGFQAHWGGVFDGSAPHSSEVSESYHPNNIRIDTLVLEVGGAFSRGGHLGLSLSACYDVDVGTVINQGWDRTDWIQPGDVYDLVAAPDQKHKVMSGIRVRYTEIINPVASTSGYNNILISGMSATIRTAGQTEVVISADRQNMAVDHGEVRVVCLPGYSYTSDPVARMLFAKDSRVSVTFEGFPVGITSSLFQAIGNTDCNIRVSSTGLAPLLRGHDNIRCKYAVDWKSRINNPGNVPETHRVVALGNFPHGNTTLVSAATQGDMTITVGAWANSRRATVPKGTRLYLADRSYVTLRRTQILGDAGTLDVERLGRPIASGTSISANCTELDSELGGYIEGGRVAVTLTNVDGVSVPAYIRRSGQADIYLQGLINRRVLFNGVYDECGQLGTGVHNINLGVDGALTDHVSARGAVFEPSAAPLVQNNIYVATLNQHVGLVVTDCHLDSQSYPVNYLWPSIADRLNAGPPQVFGNRRSVMAATDYDFNPAQGATAYIGGVYYIYRNTPPPNLGDWPAGSRWINLQPAVGQPKGYIRTTAGTWVSEGNL